LDFLTSLVLLLLTGDSRFEICFSVNQSIILCYESNKPIIIGSAGNGSPFALIAVEYINDHLAYLQIIFYLQKKMREGTAIAPRVAIDNQTKVKNIILMGTVAQNLIRAILRYQVVDLPSEYATQVLDKNHTGLISIQQITKDI
jgi:hypothetical protein